MICIVENLVITTSENKTNYSQPELLNGETFSKMTLSSGCQSLAFHGELNNWE